MTSMDHNSPHRNELPVPLNRSAVASDLNDNSTTRSAGGNGMDDVVVVVVDDADIVDPTNAAISSSQSSIFAERMVNSHTNVDQKRPRKIRTAKGMKGKNLPLPPTTTSNDTATAIVPTQSRNDEAVVKVPTVTIVPQQVPVVILHNSALLCQ